MTKTDVMKKPKQGVAYRYVGHSKIIFHGKIYPISDYHNNGIRIISDNGSELWFGEHEYKDFQEVDWTKATDEELLTEAKRRYPEGTKFYAAHLGRESCFNNVCIVKGPLRISDSRIEVIQEYYFDIEAVPNVYYEGKWAEIIEEPVEEECEKSCGENHCDTNGCVKRERVLTDLADKPQEPKAGDMVEVSDDGKKWANAYKWFFVGKSINKPDHYYCESDRNTRSYWKYIRLPEVDKAKEKAKEIENGLPSVSVSNGWAIPKESVLNALKEAIEWGRNNPKTK